jgi:hypothetical protein
MNCGESVATFPGLFSQKTFLVHFIIIL